MPNLMTHLKKVSEQKPQATYYNVDMLKYQVSLFIWSGWLSHIIIVYSNVSNITQKQIKQHSFYSNLKAIIYKQIET